MTRLTVQIDSESYITRHPDPTDGWDAGEVAHTYEGCRVYAGDPDGRGWIGSITESIEVPFDVGPGDTVYPVIVRYSTGSTFGRTDGLSTVIGAWRTYDQAVEAERLARAATGFDYVTVGSQTFYTGTWIGYFEYLEDVIIESEVVRS